MKIMHILEILVFEGHYMYCSCIIYEYKKILKGAIMPIIMLIVFL